MIFDNLKEYDIILASQSPRRQQLLKELGVDFEILIKEGVEEVYPDTLTEDEIAIFLAELKAKAYKDEIEDGNMVITADTIVWAGGHVLGKPKDREDAVAMLKILSGDKHEVITGVCLSTKTKKVSFDVKTEVYFKALTDEEIDYYVDNFKPYDKAGAYGIQEWIGCIAIKKIEGSYFNVVGLPTQRLYEELVKF